MDNRNDILVHHGIKGMKWGVRRTPEELGYVPRRVAKDLYKKNRDKLKEDVSRINNAYRKAESELKDDKEAFNRAAEQCRQDFLKVSKDYNMRQAMIYVTTKKGQKEATRLAQGMHKSLMQKDENYRKAYKDNPKETERSLYGAAIKITAYNRSLSGKYGTKNLFTKMADRVVRG